MVGAGKAEWDVGVEVNGRRWMGGNEACKVGEIGQGSVRLTLSLAWWLLFPFHTPCVRMVAQGPD